MPSPAAAATEKLLTVAIGGGGFLTSGGKSATGKWEHADTDTATGFVRALGEDWRPAIHAANAPSLPALPAGAHLTDGAGSYATVLADNGVGYTTWRGSLLRTSDAFQANKLEVVLGPKNMRENLTDSRLWNGKIAIDQANPDRVLIGCRGAGEFGGAYAAIDGRSFKRVAGIPDPVDFDGQPAPLLVAKSPLADEYAIASFGNGILISKMGPLGPYALSTGSSKTCVNLHYDAFGRLWSIDKDRGPAPAARHEGSAWQRVALAEADQIRTMAVDPRNRDHLVMMNPNGGVHRTVKDAKGAWLMRLPESNIYPTKQPYHCPRRLWQDTSGSNHIGIYPSKIVFDPIIANRVNGYHGTGSLYFNPPVQWGGVEFWDTTPGIEQVVANGGLSVPGGEMWLFGWDKGAWPFSGDFTKPAEEHYPAHLDFTHCWDMALSPSGNVVVGLFSQNGQHICYAEGRGTKNWVEMKNQPPGWQMGGSIAAFDDQTFLVVQQDNGWVYYTGDRGLTPWKAVPLPIPQPAPNAESGFGFAHYFNAKRVVASKATPGVGYLWHYKAGLFRCEQGPGSAWTKVAEPRLHPLTEWLPFHHCRMEEVPGSSRLIACGGSDHDEPFVISDDGGRKWSFIGQGDIQGVVNFSFGRGNILRFIGKVKGRNGVYEIADLKNPVIKFVTESPADMVTDMLRTIVGDMNVAGRWAYGYGGSGWRGSLLI